MVGVTLVAAREAADILVAPALVPVLEVDGMAVAPVAGVVVVGGAAALGDGAVTGVGVVAGEATMEVAGHTLITMVATPDMAPGTHIGGILTGLVGAGGGPCLMYMAARPIRSLMVGHTRNMNSLNLLLRHQMRCLRSVGKSMPRHPTMPVPIMGNTHQQPIPCHLHLTWQVAMERPCLTVKMVIFTTT